MTDHEIAVLADRVLRPRLEPLGFERVEVSSGLDHDGDAVLFVAAQYREGSEAPSGEILLDALGALHEALQSVGEKRPPYLDHRFSGEEPLDEDQIDGAQRGGPAT